jgi:hypothetical protein
MEPITASLLAALAAGAGGELGRQAWAGLHTLVGWRAPRQAAAADDAAPQDAVTGGADGSTGDAPGGAELAALAQAPHDLDRAAALSAVLTHRAALDDRFAEAVQAWWEQARRVPVADQSVRNTISGGVQHGPVIQGRDFHGPISFGGPPPGGTPER